MRGESYAKSKDQGVYHIPRLSSIAVHYYPALRTPLSHYARTLPNPDGTAMLTDSGDSPALCNRFFRGMDFHLSGFHPVSGQTNGQASESVDDGTAARSSTVSRRRTTGTVDSRCRMTGSSAHQDVLGLKHGTPTGGRFGNHYPDNSIVLAAVEFSKEACGGTTRWRSGSRGTGSAHVL